MYRISAPHARHQRGISLIEALIAFLVLSLGMLTIARLQGHLRLGADISRQRSEAVRFAQDEMERLRSSAASDAAAGTTSYADIASASFTPGTDDPATNTRYQGQRAIQHGEALPFKTASMTVAWSDRRGEARQVTLNSIISESHPALSAALSLVAAGPVRPGASGRSIQVPLAAKNLGNGTSVLKPSSAGTMAIIFDNASGEITARCVGIATGMATDRLTLAELHRCEPLTGMLLSGLVRFSISGVPDAAQANDVPLPADISLTLRASEAQVECATEAQKVVTFTLASGNRRDAVPLAAAPDSVGVSNWMETGERFLAYHCVIAGSANRWSGETRLVPRGWVIGQGPAEYKVCRFSADQDGNGTVDRNAEHPDPYTNVDSNLMQQNFLVIRGPQPCPGASTPRFDTSARPSYSDLSTVQHQP